MICPHCKTIMDHNKLSTWECPNCGYWHKLNPGAKVFMGESPTESGYNYFKHFFYLERKKKAEKAERIRLAKEKENNVFNFDTEKKDLN